MRSFSIPIQVAAAAVVALLLVSGCGGGSSDEPATRAGTAAREPGQPSTTTTPPTSQAPREAGQKPKATGKGKAGKAPAGGQAPQVPDRKQPQAEAPADKPTATVTDRLREIVKGSGATGGSVGKVLGPRQAAKVLRELEADAEKRHAGNGPSSGSPSAVQDAVQEILGMPGN